MAGNPPDPGTPQNRTSHPDVTSALESYPFIQQTPSSRVARNLETLTLTHPELTTPSSLFPAQAQSFDRLSNPQTPEDHAYRRRNVDQAARLMNEFGPDGVRGRMDSGVGGSTRGWDGMPNSYQPQPQQFAPSPHQYAQQFQQYTQQHRPYPPQPQHHSQPQLQYPQQPPAQFVNPNIFAQPAYQPIGSSAPLDPFGPQAPAQYPGLPSSSSNTPSGPPQSYQTMSTQLLPNVPAPTPILPSSSAVPYLPPQHRGLAGHIRLAPTDQTGAEKFLANYMAEQTAVRLAQQAQAENRLLEMEEERKAAFAAANTPRHAGPSASGGMPSPSPDVLGKYGESVSPLKRKSGHQDSPGLESPTQGIRKSISFGSGLLAPNFNDDDKFKRPDMARSQSGSGLSRPSGRLIPYVEVTPPRLKLKFRNPGVGSGIDTGRAFASPEASDDEPDDGGDGDYAGEGAWGGGTPRSEMRGSRISVGGSGWKSDKDRKDIHKRLVEMVDSIFESEDSLPGDFNFRDLSGTYFARSSTRDSSIPLLSLSTIQKLSSYMQRVRADRSSRGINYSNSVMSGKGKGKETDEVEPTRLGEWKVDNLERLLRLLERSVADGVDVEVFPSDGYSRKSGGAKSGGGSTIKGKSSKPPRKKRRSAGSVSDKEKDSDYPTETDMEEGTADAETGGDDDDVEMEESSGNGMSTEKFEEGMRRVVEGVAAAEVYLGVLISDELPRELYSEDSIGACLTMIATGLSNVLLKFAEGLAEPILVSSTHLARLTSQTDATSSMHRKSIESITSSVISAFPRLERLISRASSGLSEGLVLQTIYLAIRPLFTTDTVTEGKGAKGAKEKLLAEAVGGKGGFKPLRMGAVVLLKAAFARYPSQREWIMEEVLTSLAKISDVKRSQSQYRLRDGHVVHTISSLLLQLVQTCAHGTVKAVKKARQAAQTEHGDDVPASGGPRAKEVDIYADKLETSMKAAMFISKFLIQKSTNPAAGKAAKNSPEMEYKNVFDMFMTDCLTVLYAPEWPAAAVVLMTTTRILTHALEQAKPSADQTSLRSLAIDQLGAVASKLRTFTVRLDLEEDPEDSLSEIMSRNDQKALNKLCEVHQSVGRFLSENARKDPLCESAAQLHVVQWGQELCQALARLQNPTPQKPKKAQNDTDAMDIDDSDVEKKEAMARQVEKQLLSMTLDSDERLFDVETSAQVAAVDAAAIQIALSQNLQRSFQHMLLAILSALDASVVGIRTKAIRAIGAVVTADSSVLTYAKVKQAFEERLSDSSPAVRDVAVDLLGKYVLSDSKLADQYYGTIGARIADTGLGVRKRVIKIIRSIYSMTSRTDIKVDICCKLILLSTDDDDGIRDLVPTAISELWFGNTDPVRTPRKSNGAKPEENTELDAVVSIIMGVASRFKALSGPMDNVVRGIAAHDMNGKKKRFTAIFDTLVDSLIDSADRVGFNPLHCIRAIQVFSTAMPSIVTVAKAQALLPYLESPSTPDEHSVANMLLRVFRLSVPFMPKTSTAFAGDLLRILLPTINNPSRGLPAVSETVACFCAVINNLTQEYTRIVSILKSCEAKLQHILRFFEVKGVIDDKQRKVLPFFLHIASFLVANCDLDTVKKDRPDIAEELSSMTKGSVAEHIYDVLLRYRQVPVEGLATKVVLPCMSALFHAYPTLLTRDTTTAFMDGILKSDDQVAQCSILRLIHEFLVTESEKRERDKIAKVENAKSAQGASQQNGVNIKELVGNTAGFADSGVSSAIVQRYLGHIVEAAKTKDKETQALAVNIIAFTVLQGLAHPLQCLPVVICLETSADVRLAERAVELHTSLQTKHATIVNTRFLEFAKVAYQYQESLDGAPPRGYRKGGDAFALLNRWYLLAREKRAWRQDFLKNICKSFEFDTETAEVTRDTLFLNLFLADNLSLLDYKTLEEVLLVVSCLTKFLSVSALQINDRLRRANIQGGPGDEISSAPMVLAHEDDGDTSMEGTELAPHQILPNAEAFMNSAMTIGLALVLKSHLKVAFGLNEEKCNAFTPGKKGINDKPAVRKASSRSATLDLSELPGLERGLHNVADWKTQQAKLLELIDEDGTLQEPEED